MNVHTIPLHLGDFSGGTSMMNRGEIGAYVLLIIACYQIPGNILPDEDARLAMLARCNLKTWKKIKSVILNKFVFVEGDGGGWTHKRIQKEVARMKLRSEINSANAMKRHNPPLQIAMQSHSERTATHNPIKGYNNNLPSLNPRAGVVKSVDNLGRKFDISAHLDERALKNAKANAPGWDIYNLIRIYNEGAEKRGKPNNPAGAFIKWCAKYTKGKQP